MEENQERKIKAMFDKYTALTNIMKLIDREKRNSRRYCEINPKDSERRKQIEQTYISACIEIMSMIAD